jgi:hypothetical protein
MKTTLITSVLIIFFLSCSPHKEIIPKDCEELKAQGIIDSFAYPFRPGSAEWKMLTSHTDMVAAVTVPRNELQSICTQGLVYTCVYCPLFNELLVFNAIRDGFVALVERINSFEELTKRNDAGTELFDYYVNLTDTTSKDISSLKYQMQIHLTELFIAQQEFLSKINNTELDSLLMKAYDNLLIKESCSMDKMIIDGNLYLTTNILYYNIKYQPLVSFINYNDPSAFFYNLVFYSIQTTDTLRYYTKKYIQEFIE